MNTLFFVVGALFLFLSGFFWLHKKESASFGSVFLNILLFGVVGIVSSVVFFQESLGTKFLESDYFKDSGLIEQSVAKEFVAEKFDVTPLYSWYGAKNFQPAVFVVVQKGKQQKKIVINAFSGKSIDDHFPPASSVTLPEFLEKKFPKDTTPPSIIITSPFDGQVFDETVSEILVTASIFDTQDPKPIIKGTGKFPLQKGFNSVIVSAVDASGNTASKFVVVEKK